MRDKDTKEIGLEIKYQHDAGIDHPMFIVQEQVKEWGDYTRFDYDGFIWANSENTEFDDIKDFVKYYEWDGALEELVDKFDLRKVYFRYRWEFVTACFTRKGCRHYISTNKHNHSGKLRIYAESNFSNEEFRTVRNHLIQITENE